MQIRLVCLTILQGAWTSAAYIKSASEVAQEAKIVNLTVSEQDSKDNTRRLDAYCEQYPQNGPRLDTVYSSYMIKTVVFHDCIPTKPYADLLSDFKVSLEPLEELILENLVSGPLDGSYFANLDLKILQINGKQGEHFTVPYNYLDRIPNLVELKLTNVVNQPFPLVNKLRTIHLSHGSSSLWGGCAELRSVELNAWSGVPDWTQCNKLSTVRLSNMTDATSLAAILMALPSSVTRIYVMNSNLTNLVLPDNLQLKRLEIVDCQLNNVDTNSLRQAGHTLEFINLSHNLVTRIDPNIDFPRLVSMNLDNSGLHFCDNFKMEKLPRLKVLNLRTSFLDRMCFAKGYNLTELNLGGNNLRTLEMNELPLEAPRESTLYVILTGNPLSAISSLTEDMYHAMEQARKNSPDLYSSLINLKTDSKSISCSDQWLKQAVSQQLVSVDFPCGGGSHPSYPGPEGRPGPRPEDRQGLPSPHGPTDYACDGCFCTSDGSRLTARCEGVRQIPRIPGLTNLKARYNQIVSVSVEDLPDNLIYLDLRGNRITSLSEEVMKKLFSIENRNMQLAGNPIACNCDNQPMLAELHNNYDHVDYYDMTCDGDERHFLHEVDQETLCQEKTKGTDNAAGISSCMTIVAAAVYLVL